jgi:hypothetical protein
MFARKFSLLFSFSFSSILQEIPQGHSHPLNKSFIPSTWNICQKRWHIPAKCDPHDLQVPRRLFLILNISRKFHRNWTNLSSSSIHSWIEWKNKFKKWGIELLSGFNQKRKEDLLPWKKAILSLENYDYFCFSGKSLNEFYWEIWFPIIILFFMSFFIGFLRSFQFFWREF